MPQSYDPIFGVTPNRSEREQLTELGVTPEEMGVNKPSLYDRLARIAYGIKDRFRPGPQPAPPEEEPAASWYVRNFMEGQEPGPREQTGAQIPFYAQLPDPSVQALAQLALRQRLYNYTR